MDERERKVLVKHRSDLSNGLIVTGEFLDQLIQCGILTTGMVEERIQEIPSDREKTTLILDLLPKRGPEAFGKFMKVLDEDYPWLAKKLRTTLEKMKTEGADKLSKAPGRPSQVDTDIRDDVNNFIHKKMGENKKIPMAEKKNIGNALAQKIYHERTFWREQLESYETTLERQMERIPSIVGKLRKVSHKFHLDEKVEKDDKFQDVENLDFLEEIEYHVTRLARKLDWYRNMNEESVRVLETSGLDASSTDFTAKPGALPVLIQELQDKHEGEVELMDEKHAAEIFKRDRKINDLNSKIKELKSQNDSLKDRLLTAETETELSHSKIDELSEDLQEMETKHRIATDEYQDTISELQTRLTNKGRNASFSKASSMRLTGKSLGHGHGPTAYHHGQSTKPTRWDFNNNTGEHPLGEQPAPAPFVKSNSRKSINGRTSGLSRFMLIKK